MKIYKKLKQPILITGASGFVASNLVRYFVSKKIKINILLNQKTNIWRIKDIIHKHLGWLVVWGGIFGFLIGLNTLDFKITTKIWSR